MQLSKKLFLISLALLSSIKTYPVEPTNIEDKPDTIIEINNDLFTHDQFINQDDTSEQENNSTCSLCSWLGSKEKDELVEQLIKQDEDNNSTKESMQCQLLRSLFCRCTAKEDDLEKGLLVSENSNNNNQAITTTDSSHRCCDREKLKILSANALEIAFKIGLIYSSSHLRLGYQIVSFAEHHAAEAIGKHLKFEAPYRFPKYVAASILVLALGAGVINYIDEYYIYHFDLHGGPLAALTIFKLINNYFDQLNHDENNEH